MEKPSTDPTLHAIRRQVPNCEPLRLTMLFAFFAMLAVPSLGRRVLGDETLQGGALAARITLWVTRLRPRTTLVAGGLAAAVHAGIAVWVFFRSGSQPVVLPTILSCVVMIVLSAVAGSSVATDLPSLAREVREGRER